LSVSASRFKNQVARDTAALRMARLLALGAGLVQLTFLLPGPVIEAYRLFPLVLVVSGVLGVMAFRITHREAGETIGALRGLDALGVGGRSVRRQTEGVLGLGLYLGFFVPLFNLLPIVWTLIKAHVGVGRIEAAWLEHQEREQRAARMRGG
jgi:hypothetical protein